MPYGLQLNSILDMFHTQCSCNVIITKKGSYKITITEYIITTLLIHGTKGDMRHETNKFYSIMLYSKINYNC